jgi:hypothetical protein
MLTAGDTVLFERRGQQRSRLHVKVIKAGHTTAQQQAPQQQAYAQQQAPQQAYALQQALQQAYEAQQALQQTYEAQQALQQARTQQLQSLLDSWWGEPAQQQALGFDTVPLPGTRSLHQLQVSAAARSTAHTTMLQPAAVAASRPQGLQLQPWQLPQQLQPLPPRAGAGMFPFMPMMGPAAAQGPAAAAEPVAGRQAQQQILMQQAYAQQPRTDLAAAGAGAGSSREGADGHGGLSFDTGAQP